MIKSISLKKPHYLVTHLTHYYLLSSLLVTGAVLFHFVSSDISHFKLFTLSVLLVGTYEVWLQSTGKEEFYIQTPVFPLFFLFQLIGWVGSTFETSQFELMYFSYIPCMFGVFYTSFFWGRPEKKQVKKGASLFVLMFTLYALFKGVFQTQVTTLSSFIDFTLFGVWASFLIYGFVSAHYRQRWLQLKSHWNNEKNGEKNLNADLSFESDENRERYFVHDIINHTHGLNLFLSNRVAMSKGLDIDDVRSLIAEVKTLQSMFRDFYGHSHKNLVNTYDWVAFRFAKRAIHQLVDSFLPEHTTETSISFSGEFKKYGEVEGREPIVHFPSFFRVMNNLIKNMADVHTESVAIDVALKEKSLVITTRNSLHSQTSSSQNLEQSLSEIILEQDMTSLKNRDKPESLGLASVYLLCQEIGGEFHFSIDGQNWVNRVVLPVKVLASRNNQDSGEDDLSHVA